MIEKTYLGALKATTIFGCDICRWSRGLVGYPNQMCDFYGLEQMIEMIIKQVSEQRRIIKCKTGFMNLA